MGKLLSLAGAIGVLFAALPVAPAAAATDQLTACLQGSEVVCSDGASISNSELITSELQGKASVVVVPYDDNAALSPTRLAEQYAQSSGVEELILVADRSGQDRFGVYSESGRDQEILTAINSTGIEDGGEALVAASLATIYSEPLPGNDGAAADGGSPLLGAILPVILVASAISGGIVAMAAKRRKRASRELTATPTAASIQDQRSVEISEELRRELTALSAAAERYGRSAQPALQEASALIGSATGHIYELFKRIDRKKSKQNREIAQVRYLDITRKLNSTLSKDYFEDIVNNPKLWDRPTEKAATVLTALKSVDHQIIENIKQVNSSKELEFQVALDSLIGTEEITVAEAFGTDGRIMERKARDPFGI